MFTTRLRINDLDLQPANILVAQVGSDTGAELLEQPEKSSVRWLEGVKPDDSAPQYLVVSQRPWGMLNDIQHGKLLLKIGDIGGCKQSLTRYDHRVMLNVTSYTTKSALCPTSHTYGFTCTRTC